MWIFGFTAPSGLSGGGFVSEMSGKSVSVFCGSGDLLEFVCSIRALLVGSSQRITALARLFSFSPSSWLRSPPAYRRIRRAFPTQISLGHCLDLRKPQCPACV